MAHCDRGYICEVCGEEVPELEESDLYLRYILGEVAPRELLSSPERHLRCNPTLAQFIVDPEFPPVAVSGPFSKKELDPADVARREAEVTRGWHRLRQVRGLGVPVSEYPLARMHSR